MNPKETHEVTELIGRLRDERRLAILVIEHDMHVVAGDLRSRGRARPRRQDRRGLVRRRSPSTRRSSRRTWGATPRRSRSRDERLLQARPGHHLLRRRCGSSRGSRSRSATGELVCLLGGNASGKSTTLKTILGHRAAARRARAARRRGGHGWPVPAADRARPRDRAREPAAVRRHDRAREPRARRGAARRRAPSTRTSTASTRCSRACTSAATSSPGRCRAASSRWWRWAGR